MGIKGEDPEKTMDKLIRIGRLANLLRQAEAAHAVYEKTLGHRDADWAEWYAGFMVEYEDKL